MKKRIAFLLTVLMLCSFTACSFSANPGEAKQIEDGTSPDETKPTASGKKPLTIDEQVCFAYDGVKVTAKSITDGSLWGTGIKLLVENNTDKAYSGTREVMVNNCMVTSLFSCEVAAEKKANDTLY